MRQTALKEKIVVAKKQHVCESCKQEIAKGDLYLRKSIADKFGFRALKFHRDCFTNDTCGEKT